MQIISDNYTPTGTSPLITAHKAPAGGLVVAADRPPFRCAPKVALPAIPVLPAAQSDGLEGGGRRGMGRSPGVGFLILQVGILRPTCPFAPSSGRALSACRVPGGVLGVGGSADGSWGTQMILPGGDVCCGDLKRAGRGTWVSGGWVTLGGQLKEVGQSGHLGSTVCRAGWRGSSRSREDAPSPTLGLSKCVYMYICFSG